MEDSCNFILFPQIHYPNQMLGLTKQLPDQVAKKVAVEVEGGLKKCFWYFENVGKSEDETAIKIYAFSVSWGSTQKSTFYFLQLTIFLQ